MVLSVWLYQLVAIWRQIAKLSESQGESTMRELTFDQVEEVSGGDIGEVTAGAAVTGGLAGGAAG